MLIHGFRPVPLPILKKLEAWLRQNHLTTLPEGKIGKAITYALKRWDKLVRYVDYGQVEIDNNLVEKRSLQEVANAVRPVALGRKNDLFAGSHEGTDRAAMLYSLLATARQHGIEPFAWLRECSPASQTIRTNTSPNSCL